MAERKPFLLRIDEKILDQVKKWADDDMRSLNAHIEFLLARDDFGKFLALGVTVSIVLQAFINMSVVLDLMPTKGFPLPMISFGGSSLLGTLGSLGMLLSVADHEG